MGLVKNFIIKQKAKAFNRRALREKILRQEKARFEKQKMKTREAELRKKIRAKFDKKLEKPNIFGMNKKEEGKKEDPFNIFNGGFFG